MDVFGPFVRRTEAVGDADAINSAYRLLLRWEAAIAVLTMLLALCVHFEPRLSRREQADEPAPVTPLDRLSPAVEPAGP
jgi:hypothetical protein